MKIEIYETPEEVGKKSAKKIAKLLRKTIKKRGNARLLLSTGASQFEMFKCLAEEKVKWKYVEVFHLDEYIGIPVSHPASFRKYLTERFISKVNPGKVHLIDGEGDTAKIIAKLNNDIADNPIDVGVVGIGENGHIAFNDPPADFVTDDPYIVVELDERCRLQQVGEGWFPSVEDVPPKAISMSVRQIMKCRRIISIVPYKVKEEAIKNTLYSSVTNMIPATVLKSHPKWTLFLDNGSSGMGTFKS